MDSGLCLVVAATPPRRRAAAPLGPLALDPLSKAGRMWAKGVHMSDGLVLGTLGRGPRRQGFETKTVRYSSHTIDDTQRRYSADAILFTSTGWAVHSVAWDVQAQRPTLVATYARFAGEDPRLELAEWSLRSLARFRVYAAAILTAIAVPVIASVLLEDSGVSTDVGAVSMLSLVVLGVVFGVCSEHLGKTPDRWLDWSVVMVGAILGGFAVLVFVVFVAMFGSLLGLYVAAAVFGVWLVLRSAIAGARMLASRRQRPA